MQCLYRNLIQKFITLIVFSFSQNSISVLRLSKRKITIFLYNYGFTLKQNIASNFANFKPVIKKNIENFKILRRVILIEKILDFYQNLKL